MGGHYVVIKGFPCKIIDYSTSKTGKHGHAKAKIVALDIFNNRKHEDISPTSHNMTAPVVGRTEWALIDIEDGYATLMNDEGEEKTGLKLPPDEQKDLAENLAEYGKIAAALEEGKEVTVTVLAAMGKEMILPSFKAV